MAIFIIFVLLYISGMGSVVIFGLSSSVFFLLISVFLGLCGFIPFWQRHAERLQSGEIWEIFQEEDWFPILSILLLGGGLFFLGMSRYSFALSTDSPNHLDKVIDSSNPFGKWKVTGKVVEEPTLKNDYLEVLIEPVKAQEIIRQSPFEKKGKGRGKGKGKVPKSSKKRPGKPKKGGIMGDPPPEESGDSQESEPGETGATEGSAESEPEEPPEIPIDGGLVLALVYEESPAYSKLRFNQEVELSGHFSSPSATRNPGSLDYQKTLRNRGIFRTIRVTGKTGFEVISDTVSGFFWYRFALYLRGEFLKIVKQTMPYPESSFLGGVLLGLKGGLPQRINTEFRMTGVSHVLAVSGLHVTIIAGLFYGIFTLFRVPIRIFAPIIVFFLFTFALIVGWPSSAIRAALMNSLFLISKAYLKELGFKMSILFSLSAAAFYILSMSPLQLTEPGFVLSVMAIYSLAMFTEVSENLLRKTLRGGGLYVSAIGTVLFFITVVIFRGIVLQDWFFPGAGLYFLVLLWVSSRFAERSSFQSAAFEMLPAWLKSFTSAQVAILLAMMGPLSAFYFGSFSLASPVANMIAIPLIGVIVQLGMIAGILGSFVPVIGLHLALLINAANWVGVKFFLEMAHFFSVLIPFPKVSQPGFGALALYYIVLHMAFYWETIFGTFWAFVAAVRELWDDPDYKLPLSLLGAVVAGFLFFAGGFIFARIEPRPDLRVTLLDVGFGSSVLVEKGGKTLLIDAGYRDAFSGYDVGERVILPALTGKSKRSLDAVILTSCLPERISGLFTVLANFKVGKIYAPFSLPADGKPLPFPDFVRKFSLADRKVEDGLKENRAPLSPPNFYWEQTFESYNQLVKAVGDRGIGFQTIAEGDIIPGFENTIRILYPKRAEERFSAYYDGAFVQIFEGEFKIGYGPGNAYAFSKAFVDIPNVLLLGDLPYPIDAFQDFLQKMKPSHLAISFRKPSGWVYDRYYMEKLLTFRVFKFKKSVRNIDIPFFETERNGAVQIDISKGNMKVVPFIQAPPRREAF